MIIIYNTDLLVIYLAQNLMVWAYSLLQRCIIKWYKRCFSTMVIVQSDIDESITIPRSENEDGGIEFTYSFWIYVNDWMSATPDEEQHVFHKGEKEGVVNFAPKVTLDGKDNKMYIYMNTFNTQEVKIEVDNLPVKKWINVCMTIQHKVMDIMLIVFKHTYTLILFQNKFLKYLYY